MNKYWIELDYGHGGAEEFHAPSLEKAQETGTKWAQEGDWDDEVEAGTLLRLEITEINNKNPTKDIVWYVPISPNALPHSAYHGPDGSIAHIDPSRPITLPRGK